MFVDHIATERCRIQLENHGSIMYPFQVDIYKAFATPQEAAEIEKAYAAGIAWGEMKQRLFEYINDHIKPVREEYERLIADPSVVEAELRRGADRARELSVPYLAQIRDAIGIRSLG